MRKTHLAMLVVIPGLLSVLVLPLTAATGPASQPGDEEINSLRRHVAEQQSQIHQLRQQLQSKDSDIRQLQRQLRMVPYIQPPMKGPYLLPPAPALPMPRMPLPGEIVPFQDRGMPKGAVPMPFDGSTYYLVPIHTAADAAAH